MQITVKGKNVEVTEALKSYAEKRIGKISRYFDRIISIDVTLSTERGWHIAEVNVFADGFVLRGEERTNDMYSSIDKVHEKLESQIKKHKEKNTSKQLKAAEKYLDLTHYLPEGETEDHATPYHDELNVSVNRVVAPKYSLEQAIKQMESLGHSFLVFQNRDNTKVNILFKKKAGYGLLDPVLD